MLDSIVLVNLRLRRVDDVLLVRIIILRQIRSVERLWRIGVVGDIWNIGDWCRSLRGVGRRLIEVWILNALRRVDSVDARLLIGRYRCDGLTGIRRVRDRARLLGDLIYRIVGLNSLRTWRVGLCDRRIFRTRRSNSRKESSRSLQVDSDQN